MDDYRAKRWADDQGQDQEDKKLRRRERKKKRKGRRNKVFRSGPTITGNGPMEAIHLINKLNQLPEVSKTFPASS